MGWLGEVGGWGNMNGRMRLTLAKVDVVVEAEHDNSIATIEQLETNTNR